MASSYILKKLVSTTTRSPTVVPFRPATVTTIRRGFFSGVIDYFSPRHVFRHVSPRVIRRLAHGALHKVPHTLRMTSTVIGETCLKSEDMMDVSLGEKPIKLAFNVPGIEKIENTPDTVNVFLDLGLKREFTCCDFDDTSIKPTFYEKPDALSIEGYVHKKDKRRIYSAFFHLPPLEKDHVISEHMIRTKIKDGGLMLSIPKLKQQPVSQQSVSLINVKDPLFKRMGASRLARFATDDERRMMIVEMGGAQKLVQMLGNAKDDSTRKEALNAIAAIARSGL